MAIQSASAKLYTGIRCWIVDKNISAALTSTFTLGNQNQPSPVLVGGVPTVYANVKIQRLKRAIADLVVTPSLTLTNQRLKTFGGGNNVITPGSPRVVDNTNNWKVRASVVCKFPTYFRIDVDKLQLPQGTTCTVSFEEDWVRDGEYPETTRSPSALVNNFFTFRTPWLGASFVKSAFTMPATTILRIKKLASSVNSSTSVIAAGVRNPGRLASIVFSLFSLSTVIGKITRTTAAITSTASILSIPGFLKFFSSGSSANFASTLTSTTSRIRGLAAAISSAFTSTLNSETSRIRKTSMAIQSTAELVANSIIRNRFAISLQASSASLSCSVEKLIVMGATISAQSSVSASAVRPATIIINNYTGIVALYYWGATNVNIDWGDGTTNNFTHASAVDYFTKTYTGTATTRKITITGSVTGLGNIAYNPADATNTLQFQSFGDLTPTSLKQTFAGVVNTQYVTQVPSRLPTSVISLQSTFDSWSGTATDYANWNTVNVTTLESCFNQSTKNVNVGSWNTSNVTNMQNTFAGTSTFNQPLNSWNTGNVTNMTGMFSSAQAFNQPLNLWNTGSVTTMSGMFYNANAFNSNISTWNTANVTNMEQMFESMPVFNQNISSWNTSSLTTLYRTFANCPAFNQPLNSWNTANVTTFDKTFNGATAFNQPLNSWNTGNVTTTNSMFANATAFNQPLNSWNMYNNTDPTYMFNFATSFNSSLSGWNLSKTTTLEGMFKNASAFNQPIANWTLGKVTNANQMFYYATAFNQPLNGWGTWMEPAPATATNSLAYMFEGAETFNQSLNSWDTSKVYDFRSTFRLAKAFDGNISSWNTSNAIYFDYMFNLAFAFNQNISSWNTANVMQMVSMFDDARAFNQPIGSWNVTKCWTFAGMFRGAKAFDQDLGAWVLYRTPVGGTGVQTGPIMQVMFHTSYNTSIPGYGNCGISQANWDKTMIGWANSAYANRAQYFTTGRYMGRPTQVQVGRPTAITGSATTYTGTPYATGASAQAYLATDYRFAAPTGGDGAWWTFPAG